MTDLIPHEHLKIEVLRQSPGGQQVGTRSGVKVTHVPTGITATVEMERSQHRNREIAMHMIEAAITHPRFRF